MIETTIACHEGFDLDLYQWNDDAKLRLESLNGQFVYTLGDAELDRLRSVSYWNGAGCLFFRQPPQMSPREGKWHEINHFTTDSPVIRVPLAHAIRYLFVQGYSAVLDWKPWVADSVLCVNYVCGHLRGWHKLSDDEWRKVCDDSFIYVDAAAAKFARGNLCPQTA